MKISQMTYFTVYLYYLTLIFVVIKLPTFLTQVLLQGRSVHLIVFPLFHFIKFEWPISFLIFPFTLCSWSFYPLRLLFFKYHTTLLACEESSSWCLIVPEEDLPLALTIKLLDFFMVLGNFLKFILCNFFGKWIRPISLMVRKLWHYTRTSFLESWLISAQSKWK